MIIYFAGRIVAWLYGYAWPLESSGARSCLATFSTIEMIILGPLAVSFAVLLVVSALKSRRNRQ